MEYEVWQVVGGEDQVGVEWYGLFGDGDVVVVCDFCIVCELVFFVIFVVVGQECFWYYVEDLFLCYYDCIIVELVVVWQCDFDEQDGVQGFCGCCDCFQCFFCCVLLYGLQMQVVDCVGVEIEFGEDEQVDFFSFCCFGECDGLVGVEYGIVD